MIDTNQLRIPARSHANRLDAPSPPLTLNETRRAAFLINIGDLTTQSVAVDLLECVIAQAEAAPSRPLRIDWFGEGDLHGLLKAQPLPEALSQYFPGTGSEAEIAAEIANADVVSFIGRELIPPGIIAAARKVLVPMIGSFRNDSLARMVRDGHTGWLFDDRQPESIMAAFSHALAAHSAALAQPHLDRGAAVVAGSER